MLRSSWPLSSSSSSEKLMWRQVSLTRGERRGSAYASREEAASGGGDSEEAAVRPSSRGLQRPLEAVRKVTRSLKRSSSSRSGDSIDLVSERTPESSLAEEEEEEELLSPWPSELRSAEEEELGVTSGKERLLLWLGAASLAPTSGAPDIAVTSKPGDKVLLARLRLTGGGSSLGIVCLLLPRENRSRSAGPKQHVEKNGCCGNDIRSTQL